MLRRLVSGIQSPAPTPFPGEQFLGGWPANHTRGGLAVGGTLWLSATRLVFVPNRIERLVGRRAWFCNLDIVSKVGIAERGLHPTTGEWRHRLAIDHGEVDFFVVNRVEQVATAIAAALPDKN